MGKMMNHVSLHPIHGVLTPINIASSATLSCVAVKIIQALRCQNISYGDANLHGEILSTHLHRRSGVFYLPCYHVTSARKIHLQKKGGTCHMGKMLADSEVDASCPLDSRGVISVRLSPIVYFLSLQMLTVCRKRVVPTVLSVLVYIFWINGI
ncbi:hypothetical protein NC653_038827 [Populus alba x Populus x berolinensis]|uniref:Uncharacterized protein n=1 Tax=Populus alba x Populus x berolinensis TaxID=444605 RepID=A0AAD6PTU7_9ROSI|nr:hypothetical protein NC653_038827 [Populus alba x Populus x berolinensis]